MAHKINLQIFLQQAQNMYYFKKILSNPSIMAHKIKISIICYKSGILKLVDVHYNDMYFFSKHTTIINDNFLHSVGIIWTNNAICQKIICTSHYFCSLSLSLFIYIYIYISWITKLVNIHYKSWIPKLIQMPHRMH